MAKTFKEIYESQETRMAPKLAFVKRMATITHRSEHAVRMWISGRQMPDELVQGVLSKELKVPAEELFPKREPKN